eukprot:TRINITY_DN4401_c0_g1_i1.p1 TRINITY_DN4401_c0_g1~~TRINITY_DN4401_c0_g1_i1.p1  ORF type:complete len:400 (+),score=82.07 TRINITY_DN4401_c0_g1_i1:139-1338(+)
MGRKKGLEPVSVHSRPQSDAKTIREITEEQENLELAKGTVIIFVLAVIVGLASLRSPRDHQLYLTHGLNTLQMWAGFHVPEDYGGIIELNARRTILGSLLTQWREELSLFSEADKTLRLLAKELESPVTEEEDTSFGEGIDHKSTMEQKAEYMFFLFEILWKEAVSFDDEDKAATRQQHNNRAWEFAKSVFERATKEEEKGSKGKTEGAFTSTLARTLVKWVYPNRHNRTLLHFMVRNNHLPSVKLFCSSKKTSILSAGLDSEGRSPIFYVGRVDIARTLVEDCVADVYRIIDNHGAAPLSYIKWRYKIARKEHEPIPTSTTPSPPPSLNNNNNNNQSPHRHNQHTPSKEEQSRRAAASSSLLSLQKDTLKETQQLREVISYLANLGAPSPYPPEQFFY